MPGTSTPRCSSGVKWPRKARTVDDRQQRQADGDVRAVQAGEPVEDRALRVVLRREADVDVLVDLDEEERRAEQEGGEDAGLQAEAVARLERGSAPSAASTTRTAGSPC